MFLFQISEHETGRLHDGLQKTSSLILSFNKTRTVQVKGTDCQKVMAPLQSLLNTAKTT